MEVWLERLFWFSMSMVILVTVGYPVFLALASPLIRRRTTLGDAEPSVSLLISAYNEDRCIARKLENSIALDYPRDRLEIIVASDGSTDRTDEIARSFSDRGVLLRRFQHEARNNGSLGLATPFQCTGLVPGRHDFGYARGTRRL